MHWYTAPDGEIAVAIGHPVVGRALRRRRLVNESLRSTGTVLHGEWGVGHASQVMPRDGLVFVVWEI